MIARKRKVPTAWILAVAALALLALWAFWPRAEPVEVATVLSGPLVVTLDEEGETRVCERYVVSSPVDGTILRIELEPGDPVIAGETVLASLLPQAASLLDPRAREEAEAAVRAAEATLEKAGAERNLAAEELEHAEVDLSRTKHLAEDEVVSQETVESAELEVGCKGDQLLAAEYAVDAAKHQLEMTRARLSRGSTSSPRAEPVHLHSPVNGVVLRRLRESEAVVRAGEELIEVGDPSDLEIVADYLSSDAVQIRPGARVLIDSWGGDVPLEGRVRKVEPGGFTKISALGVEEQRVNVIVEFTGSPEERAGLADSFRLVVRVVVWEDPDVLQVPIGALFRQGQAWAVFVVSGGRAALRTVELGSMSSTAAQVLGGLGGGERVVLHPGQSIADGARVRPTAPAS